MQQRNAIVRAKLASGAVEGIEQQNPNDDQTNSTQIRRAGSSSAGLPSRTGNVIPSPRQAYGSNRSRKATSTATRYQETLPPLSVQASAPCALVALNSPTKPKAADLLDTNACIG
jgi:hypothetical protein